MKVQIGSVVNLLGTLIALAETEEGTAIILSFVIPAWRNRKVVVSQLVNPEARFDVHLISHRGRPLPAATDEFTSCRQTSRSLAALWMKSATPPGCEIIGTWLD
jgi:DNA-binding transcriptional LysR family regulator